MKFTKENVLSIEHNMISDLCLWDAPEEERSSLLMYIHGVNNMAREIIHAMEEIKKI